MSRKTRKRLQSKKFGVAVKKYGYEIADHARREQRRVRKGGGKGGRSPTRTKVKLVKIRR